MDEHAEQIREFLLGFVASTEALSGSWGLEVLGEPPSEVDLRAEIAWHRGFPALVPSSVGIDPTPGCAVCSRDTVEPCAALRRLALPYSRHPAYRSEWRPPTTRRLISGRGWTANPLEGEATLPPVYPLMPNLPAPGPGSVPHPRSGA